MSIETPGLEQSRGDKTHTTAIRIDSNSGGASDKNGPSVLLEEGIPTTVNFEHHKASLAKTRGRHEALASLNEGDVHIDDCSGKTRKIPIGFHADVRSHAHKRAITKFTDSERDSDTDDHIVEDMPLELGDKEESLKQDLVEALGELQEKDFSVLQDMHDFKMTNHTRAFFYIFTFVPLLLFELGHAWFNAASIRRIKKAATAYEKYHDAVTAKLNTSLDQALIVDALGEKGEKELLANEKKSSLRLLSIKHLRRSFAGKDAARNALRVLKGDAPKNHDAERISSHIASDYISKQLALSEGAYRYTTRLKIAQKYLQHKGHYNPFATKSDLLTNNDSAVKVKEIGSDLAGKFKKSAEEIALTSTQAIKDAVPKLVDQTTTAANASLAAVMATK